MMPNAVDGLGHSSERMYPLLYSAVHNLLTPPTMATLQAEDTLPDTQPLSDQHATCSPPSADESSRSSAGSWDKATQIVY